ncbi:MAG: peptide chain release factor 2 [Parcubacteria group bacterium]|nr:peptide chain release factor 2 [Parcubacteria group bacterium]
MIGFWRLGTIFDIEKTRREIFALEEKMQRPGFWNDQKKAQDITQSLSEKKNFTQEWEALRKGVSDMIDYGRLASKEDQTSDFSADLRKQFETLQKNFRALELQLFFGGDYDASNAVVSIHAGTGGTEAQDWAMMLERMILRYCEKKNFRAEILDRSKGGEAGIKSATLLVKGRYAYGYLKSEHGVHRLVRISPFDAEKMRHTSFALIEVIPEIQTEDEITIDPKDLRIDTFLAGGHGGQSVQTTYSAVRIVHLPTKITVSCQNERSQTQNKEMAMKVLKSRLLKRREEEREREKQKLRGEYTSAEWGNQIRSYVLHPYKMVKDHRTKQETSDPLSVLNGEIDDFIESYLRWKKSASNSKE